MSESLTADELKRLPLRAVVALCARCASRLRSEFDLPAGVPNRGELMAAVDKAIRAARDFAGGSALPDDADQIARDVTNAATAAPSNMFRTPATKAWMALEVAKTAQDGPVERVPDRAEMCVRAAGEAATAARMDFEQLVGRGLGEFPGLGEPVDCSESWPLGPLWPTRPN